MNRSRNSALSPLSTFDHCLYHLKISARCGTVVLLLAVSVLTAQLLAAPVLTAQAQQLTRTPVEVLIVNPPVPIEALGRRHLVYEIHLTNFGSDTLTLGHLHVYGADDPAAALSSSTAEELAHRFRIIGQSPHPKPPLSALPPGGSGVLYQWIALTSEALIPRALRHDFGFRTAATGSSDTLRTGPVPVATMTPRAVAAPVTAGRWVAVRGPSNESGHRRALVVLGGKARIPERFAIDWVRLGENGQLFDGDPRENTSWISYDQPVRASAAGEVVRVRDGLPEHTPFSQEIAAASFTPETVAGNVVVVDIGRGHFAVYAHLRPGSVSVVEGDHVQAGHVIGRIGNSGHSLAPHLHFHIQDSSDPLVGEGVAFALGSFELVGRLDSLPEALRGTPWKPHPARPARTVFDEIPLENMVIEIQ